MGMYVNAGVAHTLCDTGTVDNSNDVALDVHTSYIKYLFYYINSVMVDNVSFQHIWAYC